jgi:hypothetical protein
MKKTLAALALAGSIALIGSAPAMAATYPALPPQAAVSDGTVGPGETFVFRGQGFLAGETLTITVTPGNPPAASGAQHRRWYGSLRQDSRLPGSSDP